MLNRAASWSESLIVDGGGREPVLPAAADVDLALVCRVVKQVIPGVPLALGRTIPASHVDRAGTDGVWATICGKRYHKPSARARIGRDPCFC
jgi:hypothetical protein